MGNLVSKKENKEETSLMTPFPNIADSIDELIGNTPLLRLHKVNNNQGNIVCKLESQNPASSVKDRLAKCLIDEAENRNEISPGDTLVEPTSGNTGVALAMIAARKGYKFISVMPESMSMERRIMLRAYGAEVILTPASQGIKGSFAMAEKIVKEKGAHMFQQFENPDNIKAHRETTGPEIWEQTEGKVDILVGGVGTGGTITGSTQFLKSAKWDLLSVAVEPRESSVLSGGEKGPHQIMGIGAGFIPKIYDASIIDEVVQVSGPEALTMARRLAVEEGLMVGISGGAAVHAAIELSKKQANKDKMIVVIIPSYGERYLSTPLFADIRQECLDMQPQLA